MKPLRPVGRALGLSALALLLLLCGCRDRAVEEPSPFRRCSRFEADFLGVYCVTREGRVRFVPFSRERAGEYGLEDGLLEGAQDIVGISAEGDGHIGMLDAQGTYRTTCPVQPGSAQDLLGEGENPGAGTEAMIATARQFGELTHVTFFRSGYPIWGRFVHADGTVTIPWYDDTYQEVERDWSNVVQLAGSRYAVGLTANGTVLSMEDDPYRSQYRDWAGITGLYGEDSTDVFAVTKDGKVLFAGEDQWGEGQVEDWNDIAYVAPSLSFTVGLRSNGTVVAAGNNSAGQCDVEDWRDITAVAVSEVRDATFTAGLDAQGGVWISGTLNGKRVSGLVLPGAIKDF